MTNTVLDKLIEQNRMPVLFIGSGISKRYLYNYPDWNELLKRSYKKINDDDYPLKKLREQYNRQNLSDFEANCKLASFIENEFNSAFFDRKIKIGKTKNPKWVNSGVSPYKMFLCHYFKKCNIYYSEKNNLEISKFKALRNKVSAVITTNYDSFLEKEIFNEDFHVFVHQNELFSSDSYDIAEIYKIHGSCTDANSIIITESDYDKFSDTRKLIIAKMLTLFAESPIVFLGYSFTDENIQKIISEFLSCLTSKELENIDEHFVFVSYKQNESDLKEIHRTITTRYGAEIPITEIQTDNYSLIYDALNKITPGMSPKRIRDTRKIIKTIVDENTTTHNAESIIVGIDDLSNIDLSSKPLAVAIGYRENILSKVGYGPLADDEIIEDILYNNKHFDSEQMCKERFKSISRTRLIPVFKYIKGYPDYNKNIKLFNYVNEHNSIDKIIPSNIEKQIKNIPFISNINDLEEQIRSLIGANKKCGLLLKNISNFSLDEIRTICKNVFQENRLEAMKSTHFKRCVMYIDLHENYL
ncbi:MAG: SIR2 family protein [Lachnobacterium sp.]|nr:SIR2 family protein [Lachnobacterium sp.]